MRHEALPFLCTAACSPAQAELTIVSTASEKLAAGSSGSSL